MVNFHQMQVYAEDFKRERDDRTNQAAARIQAEDKLKHHMLECEESKTKMQLAMEKLTNELKAKVDQLKNHMVCINVLYGTLQFELLLIIWYHNTRIGSEEGSCDKTLKPYRLINYAPLMKWFFNLELRLKKYRK